MNLLSFIRNLGYIQSIYYSEYFHKEIHKITSSKDQRWDFLAYDQILLFLREDPIDKCKDGI